MYNIDIHLYIYYNIFTYIYNIDMYIDSEYVYNTSSDAFYKVILYLILTSIMKKSQQFVFLFVFKIVHTNQYQVNVN